MTTHLKDSILPHLVGLTEFSSPTLAWQPGRGALSLGTTRGHFVALLAAQQIILPHTARWFRGNRGRIYAMRVGCAVLGLLFFAGMAWGQSDSDVRPPVTKSDLEILRRAEKILDEPSKWNRADNRVCPDDAKTFSLYCALQRASKDAGGFAHRSAVMQEARFVTEELAPNRKYEHRLMGYNNDPSTTFSDIQKVLRLTRQRIEEKLKTQR